MVWIVTSAPVQCFYSTNTNSSTEDRIRGEKKRICEAKETRTTESTDAFMDAKKKEGTSFGELQVLLCPHLHIWK